MKLTIPSQLSSLPVLKTLPSIDITQDFILTAATSSGKTMLIPAYISATRGHLVILRQPTRKIAQLTHKALTEFWGDQITIGLISSEEKDIDLRYVNSYNIIVVTDGILSYLLKKLDMSRTTIVFDEVHWQMSQTEIELSLAESYKRKNPSLQIVLLSATIDPYLFVQYFEKTSLKPVPDSILRSICAKSNSEIINTTLQPQKLKVYYSEGTAFPLEKAIIRVEDINDIDDKISEFCYDMKNKKDFGLFFLSTRNEILEAHKKYGYILPTLYCHADTPIEDLLNFFKLNKSGVIFATIALSTSVTLPFLETQIVDKTNDSEYIELIEQKISKYGVPCDYNEILQKAGRTARLRPGKATLITARDITWKDIKPTNIIPPLKKELPINAALISASHNIDIRNANLLSILSKSQIDKSVSKLQNMKFIDAESKITTLGKRALALPLEPEDAKLILSTPTSLISASAAYLSFPSGMFYIIDSSASSKTKTALYSNYTFNSVPLTKINILQDAIANKHTLKIWCHDNAINYKRMSIATFNFHQIGKKFNKDPSTFDEELLSLDLSPSSTLTNSYRTLLYMLLPKYPAPLDGTGFGISDGIKKYYSFFSDIEFFQVESPQSIYKVSAKFSLFQAKGKPDIYGRLVDATLPLSLPPIM